MFLDFRDEPAETIVAVRPTSAEEWFDLGCQHEDEGRSEFTNREVRLDPGELSAYVAVPRMLDARNALDPQRWQLAGWEHRGFGRSSDRAQPSAGSRVSEMELMQ